MFIGYFDPSTKNSASEKIAEALSMYTNKFDEPANVVMMSPQDEIRLLPATEVHGLVIRALDFISENTFYVGVETTENPAEKPRGTPDPF